MKRKLTLTAAALSALLFGCDKYETKASEKDALKYYEEKYGVKTSVQESHRLGNYGLFGYSWSGMEFMMDDGTSVIYDDHTGIYSDDRQSDQIEQDCTAFAEALISHTVSGNLTQPEVESVGMKVSWETYKGKPYSFHEYYDGSAEAFLAAYKPALIMKPNYGKGDFLADIIFDSDEETIRSFMEELGQWFRIDYLTFVSMDKKYFEEHPDGGMSKYDTGFRYYLHSETADGKLLIHKREYLFHQIMPGIYVSADEDDLVLKKDDIQFVQTSGEYRKTVFSSSLPDTLNVILRTENDMRIYSYEDTDVYRRINPHALQQGVLLKNNEILYCSWACEDLPDIQISDLNASGMNVKLITVHEDEFDDADLTVIGFKYKDGHWETVGFDAERMNGSLQWHVPFDTDTRPDNEFHFYFKYRFGPKTDTDYRVMIDRVINIETGEISRKS